MLCALHSMVTSGGAREQSRESSSHALSAQKKQRIPCLFGCTPTLVVVLRSCVMMMMTWNMVARSTAVLLSMLAGAASALSSADTFDATLRVVQAVPGLDLHDSLQSPTQLLNALAQHVPPEQQSEILLQIGEMHLTAHAPTIRRANTTLARAFFATSAETFGNVDAQLWMGLLHAVQTTQSPSSTPLWTHQGDAALFLHFATIAGSPRAAMAQGYRSFSRSSSSCDAAIRHYKFAADNIVHAQTADKPMQLYAIPSPVRLTDDLTQLPRHGHEDAEQVEYLRQSAAKSSNPALLLKTASLLLFSDLTTPDSVDLAHQEAKELLHRAVAVGHDDAKALLGHVYAYGLGVDQDADEARRHYEDALNATNSSEAANGLGLLYFHGVGGTPIDYERAMTFFTQAARSGHPEAVYHAGVLMKKANPHRAREYFAAAAKVGHLKSRFQLARLKDKERFAYHADAASPDDVCREAVQLYKEVAEHDDGIRRLLDHAARLYLEGQGDQALLLYLVGSELGLEVAQANALWLLQRKYGSTFLTAQSVKQWQTLLVRRAVAQDSVQGHLHLAHSLCDSGKFTEARTAYEHVLTLSARAFTRSANAEAFFNLGYLYEQGNVPAAFVPESRESQLLQAGVYYEAVSRHEPKLSLVMTLLQWKVHAKLTLLQLESQWDMWIQRWRGPSKNEAAADTSPKSDPVTTFQSAEANPVDAAAPNPSTTVLSSALGFTSAPTAAPLRLLTAGLQATFTLESWVKPSGSASDRDHMVLLDVADRMQVRLVRAKPETRTAAAQAPGVWYLQVRWNQGLKGTVVFRTAPITSDAWTHIALVQGATDNQRQVVLRLLVSGKLAKEFRVPHDQRDRRRVPQTQIAVGSALTPSAHLPLESQSFVGDILAFRLWHAAKTTSEVQALMQTPTTHQLVITHKLDLLVGLRFDIHGQGAPDMAAPAPLLNGDRTIKRPAHVELRMTLYPPE